MVFQRALPLLAVTALLASGCATEREAPFHVYQSPLLAAEAETPRPADRTFDPVRPGDYPTDADPERVVAQNDGTSVWDANESSRTQTKRSARPARTQKKSKRPALSSRRVGGKGKGGSSSAEAGDFSPALAAAYVHKTFTVNGVALPEGTRTSVPKLWGACKSQGKVHQEIPLPGDAAFFHNAVDANADGRNNDWYTHVGIVEAVDDRGTATVLSWKGGEVIRFQVNPRKPDETEVDGRTVNSRLRTPAAADAPYTQYYAGQLFAGWCTMLDGKKNVVVMDAWSP